MTTSARPLYARRRRQFSTRPQVSPALYAHTGELEVLVDVAEMSARVPSMPDLSLSQVDVGRELFASL